MTLGQRVQAAGVKEALLQQAIVDAFAEDLADVYLRLTVQVRHLLDQFQTEATHLVANEANLARAIALRQELQAALERAGFGDLIAAAVDLPLDRLAAEVLKASRIANEAATFAPFDVQALAAFKDLRLADLLDVGDDLLRTVWRSVLDGVIGLRRIPDLVQDISRALDISARQARTIYDTAVSTYSRQADLLLSTGEPDELYLYVGPLDSVTRPFCREHLGHVQQRDEIEAMDNGQLPNPLLTGGGYNCRHQWKRVSVFDAELRALYESGEAATWVADPAEMPAQEAA